VVDYPDEDIEDLQREDMVVTLSAAEEKLRALLATFDRGRILKQGLPTVILGKPNAGKSSLLNALLGYDRAIVTDVAGTTRDTVEEKVALGHVLLRLCDTAGIRESSDTVERIGVERSRQAAARAELVLLVLDTSRPLDGEDEEAIAVAAAVPQVIAVLNKTDLPCAVDEAALRERFGRVVSLCAKSGEGMAMLTQTIEELFPMGDTPRGELLTNARQADAVRRALAAVSAAREALELGLTPDAVLTDGEAALEALGELNGKSIREDLVATIFSRFCVGK
jgi:tRNA modification GTPase